MIRALVVHLEDLLKRQGQNLVDEIRDASPKASCALKKSVQPELSTNGAVVSLRIKAAAYFKFVEEGRRKNRTAPPLENIERWCVVKGIDVRAAWPIAQAIGRRGLAPKHVLKGVVSRRQATIEGLIKKAFGEAVKVETRNLIKNLFEQKTA